MEKKSAVKDVHKIVPQDYPELYKKLSSILGDKNPFAKFTIGSGFYVWSDTRYNWHQMIAWSSWKQEEVKDTLETIRQKICQQLGEKQTSLLFSVPDDGYIYFNDDDGQMKILITGWGFKKPGRVLSTPIIEEIVRQNPVTLAFMYGGERLANYNFCIKVANKVRRVHTADDGICRMGNVAVGESFLIYDIQNGNKVYTLDIIEGQTHYDIELTETTTLLISSIADGQPVAGEEAKIQYHGKEYIVITDGAGHASLDIPLYDGEVLSATLRGSSQEVTIHRENNHIDFVFDSPVQIPETDIVVKVLSEGVPCPNVHVDIEYAGHQSQGQTDEFGQYVKHMQVVENTDCEVSVDGYGSQHRVLSGENSHIFVFDKSNPAEPEPKVSPRLIVKRENGVLVADYSVTVETNDGSHPYVTNRNGEVCLPEMTKNDVMTVIDSTDATHKEKFTITAEQQEYVFIIPNERQLKLMFRDKEGKPIQGNNIVFHQEGHEDVHVTLDGNGDTFLPKDTFAIGKQITASIKGWEDKYNPIPFEIEANEYEYILQEKPSKNSWWMVLLQILTVLILILAATFVWYILQEAFVATYENIYNTPCPYFDV